MSLTAGQAHNLLRQLAVGLKERGGSDIILNVDESPVFKIIDKTHYIQDLKLSKEDLKVIIKALLSDTQWDRFDEEKELNFMLDFPNVAYFRVNLYFQRGDVGLVMRLIPKEIPTVSDLNLPEILNKIGLLKRGLVLFSGATGVGKSTSLAAMIDYRNKRVSGHILTIEDPIEFMHENKKSIVTQREVGVDMLGRGRC